MSAHAWSPQVHGYIAVSVHAELSSAAEQRYQHLAETFWQLKAAKGNYRYGGTHCKSHKQLCFLAYWPDTIRKQSIAEIFAPVGAGALQRLGPFNKGTTASWHYHNAVFDAKAGRFLSECENKNQGKLAEVLPLLIGAYDKAITDTEKALLLSFIVHFVADAHQPLHTFTASIQGCKHDKGGNLACMDADNASGAGRTCKMSLHKLWDSAQGAIPSRIKMPSLAPKNDRKVPDINGWVVESQALAPEVYRYKPNQGVSKRYAQRVAGISAERLVLAKTRLAQLLEELLVNE